MIGLMVLLVVAAAVVSAGVFLIAGLGVALVVAGVLLAGLGFLLTGAPS